MENKNTEIQANTPFEKFVLASLAEINKQLKSRTSMPTGEYLTPNEVCEIVKISKGKFYQFVKDGIIRTIKPDPNGRKTYVLRSEIESLFPKDFN